MKTTVSRSLLQELQDFDTALLANTIGYVDPTPPHEYYMGGSIQSVTPELGPTVGVAMTCELDSSTPGNKADFKIFWDQLEEMSRMKVPVVWVVKTVGARPDHECVFGDGMAKLLYAAGCVGLVTDGGVRDVNGLRSIPFAAYSKGTTIHHCELRFRASKEPVEVGGITIRAGDVIHANAEGVIKLPSGALSKLPAAAVKMRAFEHDVHILWRRTDLSVKQKQKDVARLAREYGFASCVSKKKKR
jgi:regulator of RNase E activity RraA